MRFRSREDRIDNGLSREDRIDVLRFWGLLREQDRCFLVFDVCVGTGQDVGGLLMNFSFLAYRDFKKEYSTYHLDRCDKCGGNCELEESSVSVTIEARLLNFPELCLLVCQSCGRKYIPEYSKQMIDGAYRSMVKEGQYVGDFVPKGYKKKFDYCVEQDYEYDHRDFYNIPGLCYDDEHSIEGFLTPVYFEKQALIYFISMPEYEVNIFSETY